MQDTRQIAALIRKYLRKELTEAEKATLQQWLDADPARKSYLESIVEGNGLLDDLKLYHTLWGKDNGDARMARIHQRIHHGLFQQPAASTIHRLAKWLPYVAAILIMALVGAYVFFGEQLNLTSKIVQLESEDIAPGGNRATLTLANGQTINLSAEQSGIVVGDEDITYQNGTSLALSAAGGGRLAATPGTEKGNLGTNYYVLSTPRGGTYQVTLPDGTNVWLNAASTLKYPSHFTGDERTVELTGEAYFDVAKAERQKNKKAQKQAWPFLVVSNGQRVAVLGTQFNISAYPDEPETKTTLVAGKVKVSNLTSHSSQLLVPGQQSIVRGAAIKMQHVNTEQYTAWRSGRFSFDGKPFDQIMNEMGRWYNFTVRYEGDIPPDRFLGDAYRTDNLGTVLQFLETSNIRYRVERASASSYLLIISNRKEATTP
jgi:transmembrane sensor